MHRIVLLLAAALLCLLSPACTSVATRADLQKQVGQRAPIFSVATSQGALASYDRDYYGRHHLVLTFFPAAYTPV